MSWPILPIICFFSSGIIIGKYVSLDLSAWLALTGAAFFINLIFLVCKHRVNFALFLVCIALAGSFWYAQSRAPEYLYKDYVGSPVYGEGVVLSYPQTGSYNQTFIVSLSDLSLDSNRKISFRGLEKILLTVPANLQDGFLPGMGVEFSGELFWPNVAKNPGAFDYREYLANQKVFYGIKCRSGAVNTVASGTGLRDMAARGREKVSKYLDQLLPDEEKGLLLGLLFGDVSAIGEKDWEGYQRAGIVHLFAVSGYNIAFVLGLAWFLLSFFSWRPLWRLLWGAFILIGYYFMVGWSASIVRASIMAFVGLLALCAGRKQDIINSMALAALVILILNPGEIFQVGYQLSFIVTAGIIYLSPQLQRWGLGRLLSPALSAQLAAIPLSAWHFNQVSLIAPFLNIIAILISGGATVLGLIGCLLTWVFPALAAPAFITAGSMMYALSRFTLVCAGFQWASLTVPTVSPYFIISVYIFLLVLPQISRLAPVFPCVPIRIKAAALAIFLLGCIIFAWPQAARLEVVFLDVGQGDSIFIRTPGGRICLIDGGGTPDSEYAVGLKVVKPYLQSRGIRRIDIMVMSHSDLDHSEGLMEILPLLDVGVFLMPPTDTDNKTERTIWGLCSKQDIPVCELTAGQRLSLDENVYIEVLNPFRGSDTKGNNHSLVFRLVYGEAEWLLTGDIENSAIEEILKRSDLVTCDILKLPHHGSINSYNEAFYRAVSPQAVVASVGINNYNHPHPSIRAYFTAQQIPFYATVDNGAVLTESDGKSIWIRTMR